MQAPRASSQKAEWGRCLLKDRPKLAAAHPGPGTTCLCATLVLWRPFVKLSGFPSPVREHKREKRRFSVEVSPNRPPPNDATNKLLRGILAAASRSLVSLV